jgi:lipid A 3-O-deacylase
MPVPGVRLATPSIPEGASEENSEMNVRAVALLLAGMASLPAMALDGYVAEIGGGEGINSARIGMIRQWDKQWLTEGHWHLTGYWEGSVAVLRDDSSKGKTFGDIAFTPVFRFRPNASGGPQPYWDMAVGLHLLSRTGVNDKNDLGSALQFGPLVGVGLTFGEKSQYDFGYRFQHLSNGDIKEPNDGLNLHLVRLTYLY